MILCLDNAISGLDFNPLGTMTASIDHVGVCLISDINTNDYIFHLQMDSEWSNLSNCLSSLYQGDLFPSVYKLMTLVSNLWLLLLLFNLYYFRRVKPLPMGSKFRGTFDIRQI